MKNLAISLTVVSALTFLAGYLAWTPWPARDAAHRADDESAVLERTARRTLQESRDWVANRVVPAEIVDDVAGRPIPQPVAQSRVGAGVAEQPEGYSPGDYRGTMQRSPRANASRTPTRIGSKAGPIP